MDEFDPDGGIMVNELRIVEYCDSDGQLHTVDLSQSTGGAELSDDAYMDMVGWALAYALAGKVAAVLTGSGFDGDDM